MEKTVVGLMESRGEAENVVRDLTSVCNCDRKDIGLMARRAEADNGTMEANPREDDVSSGALKGAGTGAAVGGVLGLVAGAASLAIPGIGPIIAAGPIASALAGAGIGAVAGGLIGGLVNLGVPEEEAHYYAEGVRRGGTLITVHARSEDSAECAARVMREHGAVDIDQRAEQWRQKGWSGKVGEGEAIPVVEEELAVGKRQVRQGGVRVYSQVTETPVEETVRLREEHAHVERRPVNRPVQAGDQAFQEKSIEVRETAEQPVVGKRARVVEEVQVGKQATERDQTVRDTVRKTDVHVEKAGDAGRSAYAGPDRRRSKSAYAGQDRRVAAFR